jgi:hypothetical protein
MTDNSGHATAVVIPIEEWKEILDKHPDVAAFEGGLPQWQKDLLDHRLEMIKNHPERLRPIDELFEELNREDD